MELDDYYEKLIECQEQLSYCYRTIMECTDFIMNKEKEKVVRIDNVIPFRKV